VVLDQLGPLLLDEDRRVRKSASEFSPTFWMIILIDSASIRA
jgi:hypothetical protein